MNDNIVTVIGIWETGFSEHEQIIEWRMWKQTLAAYGVDRWIMAGPKPNGGAFEHAESIADAIDMAEGDIVLLEPWNGTPLQDFVHPSNAVYVFANADINLKNFYNLGQAVTIPTPKPTDMFGCMFIYGST